MIVDFKALAAPFDPSAVSWRVGSTTKDKSKGMALAYIDARDVMDRLDAVVGPANWRDEYQELAGFVTCKLGIKVGGEWVWKTDGAGKTDVEAEKGMLSDAFKRAAVKWSIGRYLYALESPWVALEARGNSYVISADGLEKLRKLLERKAKEMPAPTIPTVQPSTPAASVAASYASPLAKDEKSLDLAKVRDGAALAKALERFGEATKTPRPKPVAPPSRVDAIPTVQPSAPEPGSSESSAISAALLRRLDLQEALIARTIKPKAGVKGTTLPDALQAITHWKTDARNVWNDLTGIDKRRVDARRKEIEALIRKLTGDGNTEKQEAVIVDPETGERVDASTGELLEAAQ